MSKVILCAIDVSRADSEAKVLREAAKLAQADGAQLDVVTVIPDFGMSMVGGYFSADHMKKACEQARTLLTLAVGTVLGEEVNTKVRHIVCVGTTYHEVLEVARKEGADLIVLGAHRPDIRDYLLGPNAARVVRHAEVSVYVVR
ncbi:MAG: universal stress protein [Roseovarius sp. BRH_c41]|uniref:universal stress protein n=1 Tax=Roseovarius sp. BRH_c41 TaxID=1629709 RepID=UPI0005F104A7|nr:universal stress protein [Roseovarius sp. BRH_c41]KJS43137.1 MAG: universal stress protein [Roseovarius sp. BRH_c41]